MGKTPKILAFAGSARQGSYNKKLVAIAAEGAREAGADVEVIDLKDYPMPVFNEDLESEKGLPETVERLKDLFKSSDGFLISAPEYNGSITPLLKNTIDWCSRYSYDGEAPLAAYKNKTAVIMSASPGGLGGLRGLGVVRDLLENLGVLVLPSQRAVGFASKAFNDQGDLTDEKQAEAVKGLGRELAEVLKKLI